MIARIATPVEASPAFFRDGFPRGRATYPIGNTYSGTSGQMESSGSSFSFFDPADSTTNERADAFPFRQRRLSFDSDSAERRTSAERLV